MKLTGTLVRTEEKRALRILPQYFLGVFLLTALIGVTVVFCAVVTDKNVAEQDMTVALVLHDNDFLRTFGLDVLESATSVEALCSFVETDEEDAISGLSSGKYAGAVIFPDHFVGSALSGKEELHAQLYIPRIDGFSNRLIAGLADIAGGLLGKTEGGIYTATVIAAMPEDSTEQDIDRVEYDTQNLFFDFAISRENFYAKDSASGTGNQTVIQYYVCAALVLLLLLGGISCGPLLKGDPIAFENQLALHRIGTAKLLAIRYLAVWTLFAVLYAVVFSAFFGWFTFHPKSFTEVMDLSTAEEIGYWFLAGIPVLFLAAAIVVFVYTFAANQIGGILLLFLIVMIMGYASGLLAPAAYLPAKVRVLGAYLPTARMLNVMKNGMTHAVDFRLLAIVMGEAALVLGSAMAISVGKRRWSA
ncbi:MAG: ABC transporter permease [Lachnospiraceae bacterium]|nr:ABC transporter permease [Lachnospiraceae bacterium]